jgi:signal transduction histidine kinase
LLAIAIHNISQGLCLFDKDQRLIMCNGRYAELYDLSPSQILPGMTLEQILALRATTGGVANMTTSEYFPWIVAQTTAQTLNGATVRLKNGRVMSIRHHPLPGGGCVSTHEDVTERLIAEAALRQSEKLNAVGQMAGGIAHDLNNVLTVIAGAIENVLALPDEFGGGRSELDAALRLVESATSLLRRMVALSRAQAPVIEMTDLNTWLIPLRDLAMRSLGPLFRFELRTDPALREVRVDRSQLESALLNLILNARDAMPKGGAITVATEATTIAGDAGPEAMGLPAGAYFAITVRDSGPVMSAEVAARAFEPFYSSKPAGSGTGLGLTMVQQFARDAGGGVSLRSAPGAGTEVRILLPRD